MGSAIKMSFNNPLGRSDAIRRPEKRCLRCWRKLKLSRNGKLMWYKISPKTMKAYFLDPNKYWKELVCNHFIDGQGRDRNFFCNYTDVVGRAAIKEALPEEVKLTYHIIGQEEPEL